MDLEAFHKLARELETEARQRESTCIRNYGGVPNESETEIHMTRKAADLIRQLGSANHMGGLSLKITRK